jgi:hypothetical protein
VIGLFQGEIDDLLADAPPKPNALKMALRAGLMIYHESRNPLKPIIGDDGYVCLLRHGGSPGRSGASALAGGARSDTRCCAADSCGQVGEVIGMSFFTGSKEGFQPARPGQLPGFSHGTLDLFLYKDRALVIAGMIASANSSLTTFTPWPIP